MNNQTLDEQFLAGLTKKQKGLIWDYHHLLTSTKVSPEKEVEQLTTIWEEAQADPVLIRWLELIDTLYTMVEDGSEIMNEDSRAFVSEYIDEFVSSPIDAPQDSSDRERKQSTCVFVCSDGSGYIEIPLSDSTPEAIADIEQKMCDRCGYKLGEHLRYLRES